MIVHDNSEGSRAFLERLVKLPLTIWWQCDLDSRQHNVVFIRQHLGLALRRS